MEGSARGLILILCQRLLGETEDNDGKNTAGIWAWNLDLQNVA
jgi:hypothetical protein